MRKIEIKLLKYDELNDEAKEQARSQFNDLDNSHIYDEAHETVKKFNDVFGTSEDTRSWLDVQVNNFDDDVMELTGLRLRTYIINNFADEITKGKYFSLWSKTEKSKNFEQTGLGKLKSRYSKVMLESDNCPLTGVCYDHSMLWPVIEFIDDYKTKADYYQSMDIEDLMQECYSELERDLESEIQAMNGEEYIADHIEANEYEFTADGKWQVY